MFHVKHAEPTWCNTENTRIIRTPEWTKDRASSYGRHDP